MSWSSCRAVLVLVVVAALGAVSLAPNATAQKRPPIGIDPPPPPPVAKVKDAYDLGSIALVKDDDVAEKIGYVDAEVRRREPDFRAATEAIHELLERTEDVFVPVNRRGPDGREITAYVSVRREANRLLGVLPPAGKAIYEAKYGAEAARMVKQARERNDWQEMARAAALYLHTESGPSAAGWLATYMLDRGEFRSAAHFFQMLINRQGIRNVTAASLMKAAIAFQYGENSDGKEAVYTELARRGLDLKVRGDDMTVADFKAYVDRLGAGASTQYAGDSLLFGGGPGRSSRLIGGAPFLEATWRVKTFVTNDTKRQIEAAEKALLTPTTGRAQPVLPGFYPLTVTIAKGETKRPLVVYRGYDGIYARDVNDKAGKVVWRARSPWSMDEMFASGLGPNPNRSRALSSWLGTYLMQGGRPSAVFDNSVVGSLSTDGKLVYAIDDLAVPPPTYQTFDPRFGVRPPAYEKDITDAILTNRLEAYEVVSGKAKWQLGGHGIDKSRLGDSIFLGPPLPLGGRLYSLIERSQELRLACIDSDKGEVISQALLATVKDMKLEQNPFRRTQAAHLAYGEGILVVPTNAGAVFGIDVLANSLVWAYPYREKGAGAEAPPNPGVWPPPPGWLRMPDGRYVKIGGLEGRWKTTAPVVIDGKVVFTAADAKSIHCVNLRDGSPVWSRSRQDGDLYLGGVFNGKVVVVGKSRTYALGLNNGDVVWSLETGMPSGQGVASPLKKGERSDTIYYLPLRAAVRTGEPEICAINVDKGLVHAHTRSRKKDVPGNLLFYEGRLLSQTTTEVVVYPQIEVKLEQLNALVAAKKADDPALLVERGDYMLDKGDLGAAIADFRRALRAGPAGELLASARAKLYDALTEYTQRDFAKAETYLKEYEELCKVDLGDSTGEERARRETEERRRRANFLCLVGKGREAQNRLVDAFERYLELGETARRDELIQVVDEPSVKAAPDVWSQGRIASMVANSRDAKQSEAVEKAITARWRKLQATPSVPVEDLRKFVRLFGSLFGVGKDARLALAERLMEEPDVGSLLEAEQQLSLLRAPGEKAETSARAVEALARLYTRKGFLEDAAYYYRMLGEKYGRVVVADGKTGAEYLEDLTTDKRFLPYLDPPLRFTIRGKAKVNVKTTETGTAYVSQSYQFAHDGERMPFFQRNRLALRFDTHGLRMSDAATGEERWNVSLTRTNFQSLVTDWRAEPFLARYNYQTLGHLVVLQVGHLVFGIDPQNKGRVLWEKSLLPTAVGAVANSYTFDPRDGSVQVLYSNGEMQRLGTAGPLQGAVICLLTRDALTAIDPVTGRTLWTRTDVNAQSVVFGDEQNIYVVGMGEGNTATGTRAFRAYDGVTVRVRDFTNEYQNRVRMLGRNILVSETDVRNVLQMRIYDVLAGRTVWEQKFAPGSVQLRSEDPNLAGAVEPDGTVRVVNLSTTKEVLKGKMRWGKMAPKDLPSAKGVYLVADANAVYVAVNGPPDVNVQPMWGGGGGQPPPIQPMLSQGYGLRALPVNGDVYAFDRKTNKLLWTNEYPNTTMTLTHFEDMPVIVFTGRYQKRTGPSFMPHSTIDVVHKRTGKALLHKENAINNPYFHAVQMEARTGRFEFQSTQMKIVVEVARTDK